MDKAKVVKASEVAQYTYCAKAWQLQKNGYKAKTPTEIKTEMTQKVDEIKKLALPEPQKQEKIKKVETQFKEKLDNSLKTKIGTEVHENLGKTITDIQVKETKVNTLRNLMIIIIVLSALALFVLGVLL